jgi:hypothetical protein
MLHAFVSTKLNIDREKEAVYAVNLWHTQVAGINY